MRRLLDFVALVSFLFILYVFADTHRSRAALISTKKVTNKRLFGELNPTEGFHYSFEDSTITAQYKELIPDYLQQNREEQLNLFVRWVAENYYPPSVSVENYAPLSSEYPDLLLEQYKKREMVGSCYNDAILFGFLAQVNNFKVRQVYFNSEDGYGSSGHTAVELWFDSVQKWVFVDAQNAALFYKEDIPYSAFNLRHEILSLDSATFYNTVSIQQFSGYSIPKQELYSFYKRNCTDFAVSSFSNPQTKVANSNFYGIAHTISKKNNKFLEKISRFLRSLLDKSRVTYLYVDEYTTDLHYSLWYYCFNTALFLLLIYLFYWIRVIFLRKKRSA